VQPLPTTLITVEQAPEGGCIEDVSSTSGPPTSFDFGDRQIGTTSPAQGFALWVDNDTLNPRISVPGDYAQTNGCAQTLSAPEKQIQGCLIIVTFAPTSTGPKEGTLSTGPGGPTATLTGNGVTTPTPPVFPLRLDVSVPERQELGRKGVVRDITAQTNLRPYYAEGSTTPAHYDTTLVLRGDVKKTTKQLTANGPDKEMNARLKHVKQLGAEPTRPKIKIKAVATDEFGQTATEVVKVKLCSRLVRMPQPGPGTPERCVWHPSRK
jgi:hypothetical protein